MTQIYSQLATELKLSLKQVEATVGLIDEGNTIPFIARYRKEVTGGISDEVLRDFDDRLKYLRGLETRKDEIIKIIDEQGKLTEALEAEIRKATVLQRVEDLYRPYKQKKSTRASKAVERGLEPLADIIWEQTCETTDLDAVAAPYINAEKGVETTADAWAGAMDIIAERISDNPDHREAIRSLNMVHGVLTSEHIDGVEDTVFEMYYDYSEGVSKVANHRILALNRGEKEKVLRVKLMSPDEQIITYLKDAVIASEQATTSVYLHRAVEDAYKRLISPSVEREVRNSLTERAEEEAIQVFGKNTKSLLLIAPVKDVRILAIDPSFRTGCKLAVLDETGKLLEYATVYPNEPQNKVAEAQKKMRTLIEKYDVNIIPIGNGTASRETEKVVADMIAEMDREVYYTIVSEAGASVYSASKLATEEYPDIDVSIRGAISIGRRLQDPLAELVKIDPKSIGVGQYQHDVNQKRLEAQLGSVVEDCVNSVGVDLNTATPSLLSYVSGINGTLAKNIVAYRDETGKFTARAELLKVKRLGDKVFEQCAGFLRISKGAHPLDNTAVHPESYDATMQLLKTLNIDLTAIAEGGAANIEERIVEMGEAPAPKATLKGRHQGFEALKALKQPERSDAQVRGARLKDGYEKLSKALGIGIPSLRDIVEELKKPGRDPREDMPKPIFRSDVLKMEDLRPDMVLTGTVRNVVDFGAFVDIGVKQDGLVHISEICDRFIKHPMQVLSVGDTVTVKILKVDLVRQKISLTMKNVAGAKQS
ncbi:RNA-binding transcriptional accessory protein [Fusibacter paucivorans]|uniref:RNA-binding transcriptional accessory protein n=1 Tax=Fusibacter paucivorans TaxID=76009 RepID=A0ABS5PKS8_9FIRM|nr:Tex family protein [Fusibacter paucivorans]MBS7525774.1 RNA-binding transcriptional accessory protein [Fusibacter paucivorans]